MNLKQSVDYLRSPQAIREQCGRLLTLAGQDRLAHFALRPERLEETAAYVLAVMREEYPDLQIPYHSRWRHFGQESRQQLDQALAGCTPADAAKSRLELAIVSVLLDAGAGMSWRYRDVASGHESSKSEGLAMASFAMFMAGAFSGDTQEPLRADPVGLQRLDAAALRRGFQVTADNPLVGLEGRLALLRRLGEAILASPRHFGTKSPRLGNIYDYLATEAAAGQLPARTILAAVLEALGPIWPGRVTLDGVNLGDVWRHPALPLGDLGQGLVPFHKLSQWLTYSLVEPLEWSGLVVTGLDELTGLAEYRNGGLFIDMGVLVPKSPAALTEMHAPDAALIVEWRALTLTLLDETARRIRAELGLTSAAFPLAKVLEGGTWKAGRRLAAKLREGGGPPIRLASDGTVF